MNLHIEEKQNGEFAFYMDGDLQFDSSDEAVYHESLALPALCLARQAKPDGLRVLICGGGDGLALREVLRFPGVTRADLVDYSLEVVELGRTRFAALNENAFADERAQVTLGDAWEFLANAAEPYDVILGDFTVPRRQEDCRVFTVEWYEKIRQALGENGVAAFNTVSAQSTPEAFWCIQKAIRASKLHPLPYRVCIPSFRARGYGAWGFTLAGHAAIGQKALRRLNCPSEVATRQADLNALWRGAKFSRPQRDLEAQVPLHTLENNCLLTLELNPGRKNLSEISASKWTPEQILRWIPILHPSHTREMIETLAHQVMGTVRALDLRKLAECLLQRAARLPAALREELTRLRDYLTRPLSAMESLGQWSRRLFVALVILMTLANSVAPDNAFAKGRAGIGHASIGRGYGSFGRGAGEEGRGGHTSGSSFGGTSSSGSSFGSSRGAATGAFGSSSGITHSTGGGITNSGFRHAYSEGHPTDIYGYDYAPRYYSYSYYGSNNSQYGNNAAPASPPAQHQARFVADDDLLVMENGDIIVPVSPDAFLLVKGGAVSLYSKDSTEPLLALYPDPRFFQNVTAQLQEQQSQAQAEIAVRRDWLSWVGWTSVFDGVVKSDKQEAQNLEDLDHRLTDALSHVTIPPDGLPPAAPPTGYVELFVDCLLLPDGKVMFRQADNQWMTTDGRRMRTGTGAEKPCPPALTTLIRSVLTKMAAEFQADSDSFNSDLSEIETERSTLESDLSEYQSLQSSDPDDKVDYGTEQISASDAISRTESDLAQNQQDEKALRAQHEAIPANRAKIQAALAHFPK